MASRQETVDYILSQLSSLDAVYVRKMFGEYSLYYRDKVVALVADDQLYIKFTQAGLAFLTEPVYAPPYPGAKDCFLISEEHWEDAAWLGTLIQLSEPELKVPIQRKRS